MSSYSQLLKAVLFVYFVAVGAVLGGVYDYPWIGLAHILMASFMATIEVLTIGDAVP